MHIRLNKCNLHYSQNQSFQMFPLQPLEYWSNITAYWKYVNLGYLALGLGLIPSVNWQILQKVQWKKVQKLCILHIIEYYKAWMLVYIETLNMRGKNSWVLILLQFNAFKLSAHYNIRKIKNTRCCQMFLHLVNLPED